MRLTRMKLCRFASGLLQVEVARRAQIAHARLSEIESGRINPRADEIERLSQILGVHPDLLLAPAVPPLAAPRLRLIHPMNLAGTPRQR